MARDLDQNEINALYRAACKQVDDELDAARGEVAACMLPAFDESVRDLDTKDLSILAALSVWKSGDGCLPFALPVGDRDYEFLHAYTEAKGVQMAETVRRAIEALRQEEIS